MTVLSCCYFSYYDAESGISIADRQTDPSFHPILDPIYELRKFDLLEKVETILNVFRTAHISPLLEKAVGRDRFDALKVDILKLFQQLKDNSEEEILEKSNRKTDLSYIYNSFPNCNNALLSGDVASDNELDISSNDHTLHEVRGIFF